MGREAAGEIRIYERRDGLTAFMLRFRAYGRREHVALGTEADGWSYKRAEIELQNTLAKVRAGIWQPEAREPVDQGPEPSFHRLASGWLKRRRHELAETTFKDYRWRLVRHLLPFFAEHRPSEITLDVVDRYIERQLQQRQEILDAMAAGVRLKDHNGRLLRPLSNESINKTLVLFAAIPQGGGAERLAPVKPCDRTSPQGATADPPVPRTGRVPVPGRRGQRSGQEQAARHARACPPGRAAA
jgi:hypothetical protein